MQPVQYKSILWHFYGPNGKEVIQVAGHFYSNSPDAIREAVLNHRGIAVMPYWIISDCIADGRVQTILNDYTPTALEIHALYPARRFVPAKARLFIDYLSDHLILNTPGQEHAESII